MTITFSQSGYILHEKARRFYGEGEGWLSIKSFLGGRADYQVEDSRYRVDDQRYLLLNDEQSYRVLIEADHPVESFCIFFRPGLAEAVRMSLVLPDHCLLDMPAPDKPLNFFEKTYRHDDMLSPVIERLRTNYFNSEGGWLEEQFYRVMERLLQVHFNVYQEVEKFPAARPATREELYRRLQCARDYAIASFHLPVTLDEMAAVACLSPNHLLRTFKAAFGQTPHQFITALRLDEAQRLLRITDQPITGVCFAVGFESLGAFSWLFRRTFGLSPSEYRQQNR